MIESKVRNLMNSNCSSIISLCSSFPSLAGYNAYVEAIGHAIGAGACVAVRRGNKVYTIADDMPLLHFLSG